MLVQMYKHARISSWNQPVLNNKGKSVLLNGTHDWSILVRHATHCAKVARCSGILSCRALQGGMYEVMKSLGMCLLYLLSLFVLLRYLWFKQSTYTVVLPALFVRKNSRSTLELLTSIPSQGPRYTKDLIKMVPVVPLFSTQHYKGKYWLFLKN